MENTRVDDLLDLIEAVKKAREELSYINSKLMQEEQTMKN